MIATAPYFYNPNERADIARLKRVYKLYRDGLFRTCNYDAAITLLKTGKWFDKTNYLPNEEVLTYEKEHDKWNDRIQSTSTSEWEEPRHEQCNPNQDHYAGKELSVKTNGSGSTRSEVKKRGRPKAVK